MRVTARCLGRLVNRWMAEFSDKFHFAGIFWGL